MTLFPDEVEQTLPLSSSILTSYNDSRISFNWCIFHSCLTISAISTWALAGETLNTLATLLPNILAIFNTRLETELWDKLPFRFPECKYWAYSRILILNDLKIWYRYHKTFTAIWTKFCEVFINSKNTLNKTSWFCTYFNQLSRL